MTDAYAAGHVWWLVMDFGKGRGDEEKFIVLLSDIKSTGEASVFSFATSQARHYPTIGASPCGVPVGAECYRIDAGQESCFPVMTFIQFNNAYRISRAGLDDYVSKGKAKAVQPLDAQRFHSLLRCAAQSQDLEGWMIELIRQTLAARIVASKAAASSSKPKSSPPKGPAAYVRQDLMELRMKLQKRCDSCRAEFAAILEMTQLDVTAVLTGSQPEPDRFLEDASAGLALAGERCHCRTA